LQGSLSAALCPPSCRGLRPNNIPTRLPPAQISASPFCSAGPSVYACVGVSFLNRVASTLLPVVSSACPEITLLTALPRREATAAASPSPSSAALSSSPPPNRARPAVVVGGRRREVCPAPPPFLRLRHHGGWVRIRVSGSGLSGEGSIAGGTRGASGGGGRHGGGGGSRVARRGGVGFSLRLFFFTG